MTLDRAGAGDLAAHSIALKAFVAPWGEAARDGGRERRGNSQIETGDSLGSLVAPRPYGSPPEGPKGRSWRSASPIWDV